MYKKINEMQLLHKIELSNITSSIMKCADNNDITESDICLFAAMLYCFNEKNESDIHKIMTDILLFNKHEIKQLKKSTDDYKIARIRLLAKHFFATASNIRLSQSFNIELGVIDSSMVQANNQFILSFVRDNYGTMDETRVIEKFMEYSEGARYDMCVYLWLTMIITGRLKLMEKLTHVQLRTFNNNFIYALNRELNYIITTLIRYGRGNKVDIISEETIEMCNNAIEELSNNMAHIQGSYMKRINELTELNKLKEEQLCEATNMINAMRAELDAFYRTKKLSGQKVLVIADEGRRDGYREIIEKHGGVFEFVSGIDSNVTYAVNRANASDMVFFCTRYAKHKLFFSGLSDMENLICMKSTGLDSLEREIEAL